jgi:hypothetical protein
VFRRINPAVGFLLLYVMNEVIEDSIPIRDRIYKGEWNGILHVMRSKIRRERKEMTLQLPCHLLFFHHPQIRDRELEDEMMKGRWLQECHLES